MELKFETTRAFVQRKEKGRGKRDCSPDSFSLFRNKEVAQKSCICHFWDARDSVFCNCCFDLCLPDHKQAPYQSHSKVKKWSRGLDMWASAFIMSKTSASMQSSQRLRAFASKNSQVSFKRGLNLRLNCTKDPTPSPPKKKKKKNQLHQYL